MGNQDNIVASKDSHSLALPIGTTYVHTLMSQ